MEKSSKQKTIKNLIIVVILLAIVISCILGVRSCVNSFDHNVYYYETNEGYGIAKEDYAGGDAFKGRVKIPSKHKGKPVTEISDFGGNHYDVEFILPDTLLYIRSGAFMYSHIKTMTIPKSVKLIEQPNSTFNGCELTEFIVEEGNSVYDSRNNCNGLIETATSTLLLGLNTTVIPEGVTTIAKYAYSAQNTTIELINMPDSVITIEAYAFNYCNNLSSITLSKNLQSIGTNAFYKCEKLKSVFIPNTVTQTGSALFGACNNIVIYCEAISKPDGWNENWTSKQVRWGVTYEQYLDIINT